jgi:hypothetical protein
METVEKNTNYGKNTFFSEKKGSCFILDKHNSCRKLCYYLAIDQINC